MATSAYAYFGLLEAKTAGRDIPGDVAIDKFGNATTGLTDGRIDKRFLNVETFLVRSNTCSHRVA